MLVCKECGQENPDGFRFCGACATPLGVASTQAREERKVVTALFCDLVGSTTQAEALDPEDVQAMLSHYHANVSAEIERFGGTVEKFIGDAVVALFGVPLAHEDDPERAVRAALAVREWVASQSDVQVRMAVNTGEALVSVAARAEHGEHLASGDVLNTAARLQGAAPVNGILVGEQTYRTTRRVIEYRDHEPVQAKGKADPVPVWEAVQARARYGSDLDEKPAHAIVGRVRELALLSDALARCQSEQTAQLVTLVGVPGIGKSRLIAELMKAADAAPELYFWRQGRSLPYGESQSFWALAEIIKAQAGILDNDGSDAAGEKLREVIALALPDERERDWVERHVQPLAGIGGSGDPTAAEREETFAAWRRLLEGLADHRPLVLIFEDLHWADDGLLDFVDHLADWVSASPMLLVATARPELLERRPGWGGGKRNSTTLSIAPLNASETGELLAALLEQSLLPAEVHSAVVGLAEGNPLYAEEYVRMLQDRGLLRRTGATWQLDDRQELPLPDTIHGLVAARIDALTGIEKALLHDAAVVGKVFWPGTVSAIELRDRAEAERLLHALERKEFVRRERRSTVAGETQYAFLHAIVREVAYRQIPRAPRAAKHVSVARWIEALAPIGAEHRAEMLAHHYRTALELTRAAGEDPRELIAPARAALAVASERAELLNAWPAARDLASEALAMMDPDDPLGPALSVRVARAAFNLGERDPQLAAQARDLSLRLSCPEEAAEAEALRSTLLWQRGEGAEGAAAAERAVELVADLPSSSAKVWVIANRARRASLEGDYATALRLSEETQDAAVQLGRNDYASHLLNTRGMARVLSGDPEGLGDLRRAVELAEDAQSGAFLASAHNNLAQILWVLGRIEEGAEQIVAYREVTRRYGIQSMDWWVDAEEVYVAYLRGEHQVLIEKAERFLADHEGESLYMEAPIRGNLAFAYLITGRTDLALSFSERGLALARALDSPESLGFALMTRAHALWIAGQADEAARNLDELLAYPEAVNQLHWLAPLPLILVEHGRQADCMELLASVFPSPWRDAVGAIGAGRLAEAADMYTRIGSRFVAAWALLLAAEQGEVGPGELAEATDHFQRVGATPYLRRIDALTLASA